MTLPGFLRTPPPEVAVGIDAGRVAAVRLAWDGGTPRVAAHAVEALPDGAVVPALAAPNLVDPPAVSAAVDRVVAALGRRGARAALVLPDTAAKVSLVRFAEVPARAAELHEMLRWQVRKSAPFPVDQAVVSATPGMVPPEGGREFIVTLARRDIVAEYEEACRGASLDVGLVDLASFSIINAVLAGRARPAGDWLLVNVTAASTALAVIRDAALIFVRNRAEDADGTIADLVHQTTMYYEDRLSGTGFSEVLLAGGAARDLEGLGREIETRLKVAVRFVDIQETAPAGGGAVVEDGARDALLPLAGVLLRERMVS